MVLENSGYQIPGNFYQEKLTIPSIPVQYLQVDFLDVLNHNDSFPTTSHHHAQSSMQLPFSITNAYPMRIKDARKLVNRNDAKGVMEITLDAFEIGNSYAPGDTVGVLPENKDEDVWFILKATHLEDKANIQIKVSLCQQTTKKSAKIPSSIPSSSTPWIIFKQCLNIYSIPKKLFLRSLMEYTTEEKDKKFLEILCSKEGSNLYSKMTAEGNLTFIKLLEICPSCHPNLNVLIEHLPRLLPRPYSIANSPLESDNQIKIIFSVLESNPGVATSYLQRHVEKFIEEPDNSIYINCYLREHNKFRYTKDDITRDVIMISVGCGISPFLGFLEHKAKLTSNMNYSQLGKTWLFTGYRYRDCSLYTNQIRNYLKWGIITEHFECYSRESDDTDHKYVQNQIVTNANRFVEMIFKGNETLVYVCADGAGISKSIQNSIQNAIALELECSNAEATELFKQLQKQGKYREDVWL